MPTRRRLRPALHALALVLATAASLPAQAPPLAARLPVDSQVTIGRLPNGLRYYIRRNAKPEKRAELRLVVNAGSILEDATQLGMAHFLEHMAFNGTTHFRKNELVSYLQSIGVRFGADLNASTGFDETIYILPVPTDTARLVEGAFQVLEDWAHGQLIDSAEVVRERGVVLEEWRGNRGADERMLQAWLPVAFKGSLYARRLPIGTQQSIEAASPAQLRRFYRDWYRPDLMAVIAVGDFDPKEIEARIRTHFSRIAPARAPRKRPLAGVPDNAAPLVAIASDREATSSSVQLITKLPHHESATVGDYRRDLVERLHFAMRNSRFSEMVQKPDAPFLGAGMGRGSFFARTTDGLILSAGVRDGGIARGLEALLVENRRVDRFGFLATELARAKANLLRAYERAYAERDKSNSGQFVEEYIGHFLRGEAIPGIAYENRLAVALVPTITLDEVNRLARSWATAGNRVLIAQSPIKPGVAVPTEAELLAVMARAAQDTVTAYTESVSGDALVGQLPPPGRVVAERSIPAIGTTLWTLSNGVRVFVKPTDFKADEVLLSASAPGGTSLAPDSLYMSAALASQVVALGGIGKFDRVELGKKLSGKAAGVGASIGETSQGISGRASPRDLETLFQLVWLQFTAPRLDSTAFRAFQERVAPFLANRGADPDAVYGDTIEVTMSQHHFRSRPTSAATFAEVRPDRAYQFYRERFADAGRFTFVIVGNVSLDSLKPLVERYLASLPALGRTETWRDVGGGPPAGVVERVVRKGVEPKATTTMAFTGPFTYAPEHRLALRALVELVQIKLTETLREQLGGTYSPSVSGSGRRIPRAEYGIQVHYSSAPDKVDTLTRSTLALIESVKAAPPSAADVEKVREQLLRSREVELKQNAFWLSNIAARDQAGEDLAGLGEPYDAMIKALAPAQLQEAARRYFDLGNYARFVLLPEAQATKP